MTDVTFTERELDIMSVLWRLGSGTVAEVMAAMDDGAGYTTVLKLLQILEDKGHVTHLKEGRAHRYLPLVDRDAAARGALGRVVDKIFEGSAELVLARLVAERTVSAAELARMRRLLDEVEPSEDAP
jgi:BlaI family transcriptional regulator, penicillinase repressor